MGKDKVKSIHYLRGIAALMVVFYHLRQNLNEVYAQQNLGEIMFGYGAFGVDLFFIISGFIICYATERKESYAGSKFLLRRFFRIYPLLAISLLTTYIFLNNGYNLEFLVRSLIPLNANYSAGSPFFGYNLLGPAWTLTYEIAFYAIFFVSFLISHKYRWLVCSSLILLFVLGIQFYLSGGVTLLAYNNNSFADGTVLHAPLTLLASPLFIDFIYGIIIYKAYSCLDLVRLNERLSLWVRIVCLLIICISSISILSVQVYGHGPLLWGAWCALLVICCLVYERFGNVREYKSLNVLGNISYSLYISHAILIEILHKYDDVFTLFRNQNGFGQIAYVVTLSIFIAYVLHRFIELPFISMGRKITQRLSASNY